SHTAENVQCLIWRIGPASVSPRCPRTSTIQDSTALRCSGEYQGGDPSFPSSASMSRSDRPAHPGKSSSSIGLQRSGNGPWASNAYTRRASPELLVTHNGRCTLTGTPTTARNRSQAWPTFRRGDASVGDTMNDGGLPSGPTKKWLRSPFGITPI